MSNSMFATIFAPCVRPVRFVWRRLPDAFLDTRLMRRIGTFVYDHYIRDTERQQSHATWFMRNVPQLEVLRDRLAHLEQGATVRVASIGCSTGVELYSALWVIRTARPDFNVVAQGVDISADVVEVARRGIYRANAPAVAGGLYDLGGGNDVATQLAAFEGLVEPLPGGAVRVQDWLREGVSWNARDATDPHLLDLLGPQDVVLARNFLGPMDDALAEACLRNIARLVVPQGCLVVDGVDLDLKERVVRELDLVPIPDRIEEVHTADPSKKDWPWTRWSHEPMDRTRPDWILRYCTVFYATANVATPWLELL